MARITVISLLWIAVSRGRGVFSGRLVLRDGGGLALQIWRLAPKIRGRLAQFLVLISLKIWYMKIANGPHTCIGPPGCRMRRIRGPHVFAEGISL